MTSVAPNTESRKHEILLLDYQKTLEVIHKQVDALFKIKEWAVLSCSAVIAYAVSQKSYLLLLSALPLITGFFFIEMFFREFHNGCIRRAEKLEEMIQDVFDCSNQTSVYIFGISRTFREVAKEMKNPIKILFNTSNLRTSTGFLYVLILFFTAAGMLLIKLIK